MIRTGCALCPRHCGVDRAAGQRGYCRAGDTVEVFRYGPHRGEEPPISGTRGSGTIFFSRCTMRCLYCQNFPWSQCGAGTVMDAARLAGVLRELANQGCHNWNLVSPTPWIPAIAEAVDHVRASGQSLPVVYNTSGFEDTATLADAAHWVDIYLTDLRYATRESAAAGSDAPEYVDVARAALLAMWNQAGPLDMDDDGVARRGTICRMLILPERAEEAVANLEWLAATVGTEIAVSVMAQYTPTHLAPGTPGWDRAISRVEYDRVVATIERLGFDQGWIQEYGEPPPDGLLGCTMQSGG